MSEQLHWDTEYLSQLNRMLRNWNIAFEAGLTDGEVDKVESQYGFRFPPDLRQFLQCALPVSNGWVNWRENDKGKIQERLEWPIQGMCFDIERNVFWMPAWGNKPTDITDALHIAKQAACQAPRLIPIFHHRYVPDEPHEAGNPVLSVYQTDIIHYGNDLADYFANEFKYEGQNEEDRRRLQVIQPDWAATSPRAVRFWDEIIQHNENQM